MHIEANKYLKEVVSFFLSNKHAIEKVLLFGI